MNNTDIILSLIIIDAVSSLACSLLLIRAKLWWDLTLAFILQVSGIRWRICVPSSANKIHSLNETQLWLVVYKLLSTGHNYVKNLRTYLNNITWIYKKRGKKSQSWWTTLLQIWMLLQILLHTRVQKIRTISDWRCALARPLSD